MQTETKKFKKGTAGHKIAQLVRKYGSYSMGIYILEEALRQAAKADSVQFNLSLENGGGSVYMTKTPGYIDLRKKEHEIFNRVLGHNA